MARSPWSPGRHEGWERRSPGGGGIEDETIEGWNRTLEVILTGGLSALTRAVAVAHGKDGIRANVILPGPMDTPVVGGTFSAQLGAGRVGLWRGVFGRLRGASAVGDGDKVGGDVIAQKTPWT